MLRRHLAVSMAVPLLAPTAAAAAATDFEAIERELQAEIDAGQLPSVAYALVTPERVLRQRALGWADRQARRPARVDTPYALASLTKPLLATLLMQQHERGRLELDAPVRRHFASAPESLQASLRQLMSHSSGLSTYAHIAWQDRGERVRPLESRLSDHGFAAQPAGRLFEYANLGYGLLGRALERQQGQELGTLMRKQLFLPLGMRQSSVPNGFEEPVLGARKYDAQSQPLPPSANDTPGAGNAWSSVADLARFAAFHLGAAGPLSRAARTRMQEHREPEVFNPYYGGARYGLGWYVRDRGPRVVWHEGGMPGASSLMVLLPQQGLGVVVLINATDQNARVQALAQALLKVLKPELALGAFDPVEGFEPYRQQNEWQGRWEGQVRLGAQTLPLAFELGEAAKGWLDQKAAAFRPLLAGPLMLGAWPLSLPGAAAGDLLLLRLRRDGERLQGAVVSYASLQRLEHLLPYPAQLLRRS